SKSNWPKPGSSESGQFQGRAVPGPAASKHSPCSQVPAGKLPHCTVSRPSPILFVTGRRYIRRARTNPFSSALHHSWAGLGKVEELSTLRKRAFHERPPARLFSRQAAGVEGRDSAGIAGHAADAAGGERQSSRSRRPRIVRDRPRDRTARPRPPAQADLQDRRGAAAHRRQHLRLLRGDRRADLAEAAGSPPDRHALGGGAGAPRETREDLSRRVGFWPPRAVSLSGVVP